MKMDHFTTAQCAQMVKGYYKNDDSNVVTTFRDFREDNGALNRPTAQVIGKILKKFEETESVADIVRPVHHYFARFTSNIVTLSESVAESKNMSISRRFEELGLSYGTTRHSLPCKVQLRQQPKPSDHAQCRVSIGCLNNK